MTEEQVNFVHKFVFGYWVSVSVSHYMLCASRIDAQRALEWVDRVLQVKARRGLYGDASPTPEEKEAYYATVINRKPWELDDPPKPWEERRTRALPEPVFNHVCVADGGDYTVFTRIYSAVLKESAIGAQVTTTN